MGTDGDTPSQNGGKHAACHRYSFVSFALYRPRFTCHVRSSVILMQQLESMLHYYSGDQTVECRAKLYTVDSTTQRASAISRTVNLSTAAIHLRLGLQQRHKPAICSVGQQTLFIEHRQDTPDASKGDRERSGQISDNLDFAISCKHVQRSFFSVHV